MPFDNSATDEIDGEDITPASVDTGSVETGTATVATDPTTDDEAARKVDIDAKADLDTATGVLQSTQVPDLAITSVTTVPDQDARLDLSVEEGDVAIETGTDTTYIFTGGDPSVDADWSEIVLDVLEAIDGASITPSSVDTGSVNTEEGEITNETFIRARRDADSSSTAAGTFINLFDGETKDNRNEFDSSGEFSPDKDGEYEYLINTDIRGNTVEGDELSWRLLDTDDNLITVMGKAQATGGNVETPISGVVDLSSSKTYKFTVANNDSSFVIAQTGTEGEITRSVVQ